MGRWLSRWRACLAVGVLALMLVACSNTPKYVIPKGKMASLMADMYTAESIVESNRAKFSSDSLRKVLKQSVLLRHGVTQEEFDTSMVWYGHNLSDFIEVYDQTIDILQERVDHSASLGNAALASSVDGDSIDAWLWARHYTLSPNGPSSIISFQLPRDENWDPGDAYTLAMKFVGNRDAATLGLTALYDDGSVEFVNSNGAVEGWTRVQLITDSTRVPVKILGHMSAKQPLSEDLRIDSVELLRTRLRPALYHQRYRQRQIPSKK